MPKQDPDPHATQVPDEGVEPKTPSQAEGERHPSQSPPSDVHRTPGSAEGDVETVKAALDDQP